MSRSSVAILMAVLLAASACAESARPATTTTLSSVPDPTVPPATTTVPATTTTATTLAPPRLPDAVEVSSLAWSGSFAITASTEFGPAGVSGTVQGAFVAPDSHRIRVEGEFAEVDPEGDAVTTEPLSWEAVAEGEMAWITEDGVVDEVYLADQIDDRFGVLSSAGGGIVLTAELLAELDGRPGAVDDDGGHRTVRYVLEGAAAEPFVELFSNGLLDTFGGFEPLVVELTVDAVSGVTLAGAMRGETSDDEGEYTIELSFSVTAIDDPGIVVPHPDADP